MSDDEPSVPDRGLENLSLEEASAQHHSPLAPVSSASDLDSASISEASAVSPSSPPDSSQTPLQPHGAVHARDFAASTSSSSKPLNVPPQASTSQNKLGALRNRPSGSNVPIPPGLREKMAVSICF